MKSKISLQKIDKASINKRFIMVVDELLKTKKVSKKGEIAASLEISVSALSELLQGRLNVSTEHAACMSYFYGVSLDWLLMNEKPMFRSIQKGNTKDYNFDVANIKAQDPALHYEIIGTMGDVKVAIESLVAEIAVIKERMSRLEENSAQMHSAIPE